MPGGGHTRGIVSPTPGLLFQLSNFPPNAWVANKTTWSPRAGSSERVFRDTASLLDTGGLRPETQGAEARPLAARLFVLSAAGRRCGVGVGQRELPYRKIKHFSVNMCAVLLEQCYHCEWNGPKGLGDGAGRERKDGFNYLQG